MKRSLTHITLLLLLLTSIPGHSDDTELYIGGINAGTSNARPKVLIILDNSGSMSTLVPGTRQSYNPATTYATQGNISSNRVYWSTNGTPPAANTDQWFLVNSNRCASSTNVLATTGAYSDFFNVWRESGSRMRWRTLNNTSGTQNAAYIDCNADITNNNASNPGSPTQAAGYPLNTNAGPYTANVSNSNASWSNDYTIYTANYMNWYHNTSLVGPSKSRIQIAREVTTSIVNSNPNVDFGLMIFNTNNTTPHGGRLIYKINANMTTTQRTALTTTISAINAETFTPLCETMYEAYRYFAGLSVYYGDDQSPASPPRDTSAESAGRYVSPIDQCQQVYVIYMTDGDPTNDNNADPFVDALPNIGATSGSRLDELAGWLYRNDIDNDPSNGTQRVITYTIGFTLNAQLLDDTASKGGGRYYIANDSLELANAFQGALSEILSTDTTFTSPAVAVNSFNRSRSMDDIYMAMFKPQSGVRWPGNLKKLRVDSDQAMVDVHGIPAIDPATGNIKDTAQTYWSNAPDGGSTTSGGAGELLAARSPASRVVKTNTGANGALENFATSNSNLSASDFNAADSSEKDALIQWARGVDVDDENENGSTTDTRPWIIGDPLHSRPLVLNYGARGTYTASNPDIRIVMGTNHGVLHMFAGDSGQESWAFMPKELLALQKPLRQNATSSTHLYGVDGSAVAYIEDANNDGTISGSDKVYLYVGLSRGGNAYYALDVSNPDTPNFLWRTDASKPGMGELGQSWSTPTITRIPGHSNPVLVIGAGYDTNKDGTSIGSDDAIGRGLFIVDAFTGELVWSVTPASNSARNLQAIDLTDSIPAQVSVLDSNGDGLSDRIYAPDTGGNIWRIDMPGNSLPTSSQTAWSIFKLASVGGTTTASDRRFYSKIDVARARDNVGAYEALMVGSGNRAHPLQTAVSDRFYMIRDIETLTRYHGAAGVAIPAVITEAQLYDATSDIIQVGTSTEQNTALAELASKRGWYITLERSGEKSLSSSILLEGTIYFTTFTPQITNTLSCTPAPGTAYLYAVDIHDGRSVFNWETSLSPTTLTKADRSIVIGDDAPDTITLHFGEDDTDGSSRIDLLNVCKTDPDKCTENTGAQLNTVSTYWYREK